MLNYLSVCSIPVPPTIRAATSLLGCPIGEPVTLTCSIEAYPKPISYWMRTPGTKHRLSTISFKCTPIRSLFVFSLNMFLPLDSLHVAQSDL
jgi:hypothetical protein